ncbi:TonB-dependent siderophore receptor [uncultured Sphingomonas sp.]|uniref:TonB-dependent siderophore receptor n=1 Tax=uncultured Sphingomonas sp. TaxID=158754 RepID=UPI00261C29AF|nr:TonB-dependent siderophore receptor [uncultured Sphingomonas sp.]
MRKWTKCCASLVAICAATGAWAQDRPPAAQPGTAEKQLDVDDITVTGKRETMKADIIQIGGFQNQSILDTPLSVQVMPHSLLEAQAATGLADALRNTPGVSQFNTSPLSISNFIVRGVYVEPRTNYRLNGSLPIINLANVPLEDKERVEVLKGVSALYYGFTSPTAVFNFVSRRAGPNPLLSLTLSGDGLGSVTGQVDASRTFGSDGQFGARFNMLQGHIGTYIDGVDGRRSLYSGAFDVRATDRLSFRFDVEHYERDIGDAGSITIPAAVNGVIALPRVPSPSTRTSPYGTRYYGEATNVLARADYKIGSNWSAIVEAGVATTTRSRTISTFTFTNVATGAGTLSGNYQAGQLYRNRNLRGELRGRLTTGPVEHNLTIGYTYNSQLQTAVPSYGFPTGKSAIVQNLYDPIHIDLSSIALKAPTRGTNSTNIDRGAYLLDRMVWGPVSVIAGIRHADFSYRQTGANYDTRTNTPMGAVIVKLAPRVSLYGTYIEGLETSGTAPDTAANANQILPPSMSRQYEAGVKAEFGNLLLTADYFNIDRALTYTNAANVYVLDGRARYRGFELSAQGQVTRNLTIAATFGHTDARQTKTAGGLLDGKSVEATPRYSGSLFAEYSPPMIEGFAINGGVYYQGKSWLDPLNQGTQSPYALLSAGLRQQFTLANGNRLTLRLNADNLANKRYWMAGNRQLNIGAPRTVKFSLRYDL